MKGIFSICALLLLIYQSFSQTQDSFIGEVKFSILEPAEFQNLYGTGWVLMNGQDISGSELEMKHGLTNSPNAQGRFIRIIDLERDTLKRVDIDRSFDLQTIGDMQEDATKIPQTSFTGKTTSQGDHEHTEKQFVIIAGGGLDGGNGNPNNGPTTTTGGGRHNHNVIIDDGGDKETRPKNIILYAYLKIN